MANPTNSSIDDGASCLSVENMPSEESFEADVIQAQADGSAESDIAAAVDASVEAGAAKNSFNAVFRSNASKIAALVTNFENYYQVLSANGGTYAGQPRSSASVIDCIRNRFKKYGSESDANIETALIDWLADYDVANTEVTHDTIVAEYARLYQSHYRLSWGRITPNYDNGRSEEMLVNMRSRIVDKFPTISVDDIRDAERDWVVSYNRDLELSLTTTTTTALSSAVTTTTTTSLSSTTTTTTTTSDSLSLGPEVVYAVFSDPSYTAQFNKTQNIYGGLPVYQGSGIFNYQKLWYKSNDGKWVMSNEIDGEPTAYYESSSSSLIGSYTGYLLWANKSLVISRTSG